MGIIMILIPFVAIFVGGLLAYFVNKKYPTSTTKYDKALDWMEKELKEMLGRR